ncbi:MAG: hypothetical protein CYPHOPRED_005452 [Cyphobasidiales sp. Tagirdzhanova-0007]|nr:MAG: hypothetical protein CYPHOPRED_005452 [Cyphobasidiales sp. Tagirdzhanova-0007]
MTAIEPPPHTAELLRSLEKLIREGCKSTAQLVRLLRRLKKDFSTARDAESTERASQLALDCLHQSENAIHKEPILSILELLTQIMSCAPVKAIPQCVVTGINQAFAKSSIRDHIDIIHARLRLLNTVLNKHERLIAKDRLQNLVEPLRNFCYMDVIAAVSSSRLTSPQNRVLAIQPMGRFMLPAAPSRSKAPRFRKYMSSSSLTSAESGPSDSEISGSETASFDESSIRYEALKCLILLAKIDSSALHSHWPFFLRGIHPSLLSVMKNDISLQVRSMAAQSIRQLLFRSGGYLALAREISANPTYISLSQSLASIAKDLNKHVKELLETEMSLLSKEMQVLSWELAETVISVTPYERLGDEMLPQTVAALISGLKATSLEARQAAISALTSAMKTSSGFSVLRSTTSQLVVAAIEATLDFLHQVIDQKEATLCWNTLAALFIRLDALSTLDPLEQACEISRVSFANSTEDLQEAQIAAFVAGTSQVVRVHLENQNGIQKIMHSAIINGIEASIGNQRTAVQAQLAEWVFQNANVMSFEADDSAVRMILALTKDPNKAFRIRAYRSLAAIAQIESGRKHTKVLVSIMEAILSGIRNDPATQVRGEALWTLANNCSSPGFLLVPELQKIHADLFELVEPLAKKGQTKEAEMLLTSSVRILGCLLSQPTIVLGSDRQQKGIRILVETMLDSWAKVPVYLPEPKLPLTSNQVQWNAATALKAISMSSTEPQQTILNGLFEALTSNKNVKVRVCVVSAVEVARGLLDFPDARSKVLEALCQLENEQSALPFKEIARMEQLRRSLQMLLDRLSTTNTPVLLRSPQSDLPAI